MMADGRRSSQPLSTRLAPALVCAAVLAVYLPILFNGFVNWDDGPVLLSNPHLAALEERGWGWMLTSPYNSTYQPLVWLVYGIVLTLFGLSAPVLHGLSLACHLAMSLALYGTALALFASARGRAGSRPADEAWAAAAAAVFFAVHPLQVEAVAMAAGLADVMASLFGLLALRSYLLSRGERMARAWLWFLASAASRWHAAAMPVLLLMLDAWVLERLPADPRRWLEPGPRRVLVEKLPFLALSAVLVAVHGWAKASDAEGVAVAFRPAETLAALVFYPSKLAWPGALLPYYVFWGDRNPLDLGPGLCALAVLAAAAAPFLLRSWPLGIALASYAVSIAPTLGLYSNGMIFGHDRHAYFACLGFFLLAGAGFLKAWRRAGPGVRSAFAAGLVGTALLLALQSREQALAWRDPVSFWERVLECDPREHEAHLRLIDALFRQGRWRDAASWAAKLAPLDPDRGRTLLGQAYANLALDLWRRGDSAGAVKTARYSLEWDGSLARSHSNLGLMLLELGKREEAATELHAACALDPKDEACAKASRLAIDSRSAD
ncbi:MAG: tetratricopeptide repeat protein [Elusimicrobiota bacterium]|jgi:tetratricopeptide (TPR) repeat protein